MNRLLHKSFINTKLRIPTFRPATADLLVPRGLRLGLDSSLSSDIDDLENERNEVMQPLIASRADYSGGD
jgi:hypothetical protein